MSKLLDSGMDVLGMKSVVPQTARRSDHDASNKGGTHLRNSMHVVRPTWKSGTMSPNSLPTLRMHSRTGFRRSSDAGKSDVVFQWRGSPGLS